MAADFRSLIAAELSLNVVRSPHLGGILGRPKIRRPTTSINSLAAAAAST